MKKALLFIGLLSSLVVNANKKETTMVNYPATEDVRCEKLTGHGLADFKSKLVENCDLNKPFSSSLSRILNEDTYFYCCQIKK